MKVIVINLAKRIDRMEAISAQLNKYKIEFERFEAIAGPDNEYLSNGHYGCFLSHKAILERRQQALVLEDDAVLCDNFLELFNNLTIKNSFLQADLLYLGGWKQSVRPFNESLEHADRVLCTHAYVVDGKFCDSLLEQMQTPDKIDLCFNRTDGKKYIAKKILVTQAEGFSDIEHEVTNNLHLHG